MKKKILLLIPIILAGCEQHKQDRIEAQKNYDEIRTSNNPGSLFRVAESMRKTGNFEVAAKTYQQAIQVDPTMIAGYIGLSQCLRLTGHPAAAQQTLNSVPQDRREISWYKELGSVQTASQKPKLCIEAYKKAHEMNPSDAGTLNGLAVCNDLIGQHTEAQKWYRQAIAASPMDTNLKSNYGLSLALSSKPREAIEILHEVVESESATTRDRQNLAMAYGLAGDMDTASKLFSQDLGQSEVRTNLAFVHKLASTQHLTPNQKIEAGAALKQEAPQQFEQGLVEQGLAPKPAARNPNNPPRLVPAQRQAVAPVAAPVDDAETASYDWSFETNLAAEDSNNTASAAPQQQQAQPQAQAVTPVSTDSHVVVSPLPTTEPYHDAPIPSVVQQVKDEQIQSGAAPLVHNPDIAQKPADNAGAVNAGAVNAEVQGKSESHYKHDVTNSHETKHDMAEPKSDRTATKGNKQHSKKADAKDENCKKAGHKQSTVKKTTNKTDTKKGEKKKAQ